MNKDRLQMYISVTKITIILCWLSLIAFWAIKIFGGNWFEIMVENENFIKFCEYAESSWIKHLINFFTIAFYVILMFGAVSQKFFFKDKHLFAILLIIVSIWSIRFVPNLLNIHFWFGYSIVVIYGIIVQKGIKKTFGIISVILDFVFSTISILTRNIPLEITRNFLVGNILLIDMYLMYALYYLYSNLIKMKKEK